MKPDEVRVLLSDVEVLLARETQPDARERLTRLRDGLEYRRRTGRWKPGEGDAWRGFAKPQDTQ